MQRLTHKSHDLFAALSLLIQTSSDAKPNQNQTKQIQESAVYGQDPA